MEHQLNCIACCT